MENILHIHFRGGSKVVLKGAEADNAYRHLSMQNGNPYIANKGGWEVTIFPAHVEAIAYQREEMGRDVDYKPAVEAP